MTRYGAPGSGLVLDLVYNPLGAFLPPPQEKLEAKYKEELEQVFGIVFNSLFTITNMPIKRFADFLHRCAVAACFLLLQLTAHPDVCVARVAGAVS